uniref:Uncharacterized protein n=1 Tax=Myxococcus fulvus TaxID=33 RepID=A0A3S7QIP3_MYXFU|nr:hypothetical protein [Myxococcus fulvus]
MKLPQHTLPVSGKQAGFACLPENLTDITAENSVHRLRSFFCGSAFAPPPAPAIYLGCLRSPPSPT